MAAREHLVPAWQPAMLEDRIRVFEGRPQLYGTQLEPDEQGNMRPRLAHASAIVEQGASIRLQLNG